MDSNGAMKLMVQYLIGLLILVTLSALYMKYAPKENLNTDEDQIEVIN